MQSGPSASSTSNGSPSILTPSATLGISSPELGIHQLIDSTVYNSSAIYFETRPPLLNCSGDIVTYKLVIPPNVRPEQLPFPEPEHTWLARDVSRLDWSTFANHLLPPDNDEHADEKKMLQDSPAGTVALTGSASSLTFVPRKPVASADTRSLLGRHDGGPKVFGPTGCRQEPEADRLRRIESVVADWNWGFFQPRGVRIEEVVMPYSSALIAKLDEASPLNSLTTEGASGSCEDSTLSDGPSGKQRSHTNGPRNFWGFGRASVARNEATAPVDKPTSTKTITSAPVPAALENGPQNTSHDVLPGASPTVNSDTHNPSAAKRPKVSLLSRLSTTSNAAQSVPSSEVDNLDDAELKELRSAFAKFLLSSRSREETAVALRELNQELEAQRQQTVKDLKVEMKARRKEVKALTRQNKVDQRTEKQKMKAAEKMRKENLKNLKRERKDLEKRQKEARKEAKFFKKNAKKAVKGRKIGSEPYKGWLESLESNQLQPNSVARVE